MQTAGSLMDVVHQFFSEQAWQYVQAETIPVLRVSFAGDEDEWACLAQVYEAEQIFLFYSICPFVPSDDRQTEVAEFLARANAGMMIGNFEMNPDTKQIRFKTSLDVEGDRLTTALVKRVVFNNVLAMNRYLPALKTIELGIDAITAIRQAEETFS